MTIACVRDVPGRIGVVMIWRHPPETGGGFVRRPLCLVGVLLALCVVATGCERQEAPAPTTVTVTSAGDAAGDTGDATTRSADGGPAPDDGATSGSAGEPSESVPDGTATATTVAAERFAKAPGEYFFVSPSKNVFCGIRTSPNTPPAIAAGCQARTSVTPRGGPSCTNADNNAYLVAFENRRVVHRCTSQGIFTAEQPRVLEYGQALDVGGYRCESRPDGVSCVFTEPGVGFTISREVNRWW
ncbi:hypothetical protein GCM10009624_22980 [Gordonia sinesedis]